jgi:hypothetical protein
MLHTAPFPLTVSRQLSKVRLVFSSSDDSVSALSRQNFDDVVLLNQRQNIAPELSHMAIVFLYPVLLGVVRPISYLQTRITVKARNLKKRFHPSPALNLKAVISKSLFSSDLRRQR